MFGVFKSFLGSALMPLPMALALAVIGGLLWWRRHRWGPRLVTVSVLMVAAFSWAPVADRLLGPLERVHAPLLTLDGDSGIDAVVVLSGGWQPEPEWPVTAQLHASTLLRLAEGIRLWQQQPQALLVVTGGSRNPKVPGSALGMSVAAQALGVPADRIMALDGPLDTAQEALAVRAALGQDANLVVVTAASHMARAILHFERVGLAPLAAPTAFKVSHAPRQLTDWLPSSQHLRKSERALYERFGRLSLPMDHRRVDSEPRQAAATSP